MNAFAGHAGTALLIDVDAVQPRLGREGEIADASGVELIYNSFVSIGKQLQPIAVDENNRLVYGLSRLEAARRIGWATIEAIVLTDLGEDPAERALLAMHENGARTAWSPAEIREFRRLLEPLLAARTAENRRAGGLQTASERWGSEVAAANFATATDERSSTVTEVAAANFAPAISTVLSRPGDTRTILDELLPVSHASVEKMMKIDAVANDETKPDEVRRLAQRELAKLDKDGKYEPHFQNVMQAVARAEEPHEHRVERERALVLSPLIGVATGGLRALDNLTMEKLRDTLENFDAGEDEWEAIVRFSQEFAARIVALNQEVRRPRLRAV